MRVDYLEFNPVTIFWSRVRGIEIAFLVFSYRGYRHPAFFRIGFDPIPYLQLLWCINIDRLGVDIDGR